MMHLTLVLVVLCALSFNVALIEGRISASPKKGSPCPPLPQPRDGDESASQDSSEAPVNGPNLIAFIATLCIIAPRPF